MFEVVGGSGGIKPYINIVNNISDITDITNTIIKLHKINIYPFFNIGSGEFKEDSNKMILYISQAGLSLPSKDYYFDKDKQDIVKKYKIYIYNQLVNYGYKKDDATDYSNRILEFEIKLANLFLSKTEMRDSNKTYNTVELKDKLLRSPLPSAVRKGYTRCCCVAGKRKKSPTSG